MKEIYYYNIYYTIARRLHPRCILGVLGCYDAGKPGSWKRAYNRFAILL